MRRTKSAKSRERFDDIFVAYMQDARRSVARARRHLSGEEPDGSDLHAKIVDLLPLAIFMANKYRRPGFDIEDLIQIASVVIVRTVPEYRPGEAQLRQLVSYRIKWAFVASFRSHSHCIRLPNSAPKEVHPRVQPLPPKFDCAAVTPTTWGEELPPLETLLHHLPVDLREVFEERLTGVAHREQARRRGVPPDRMARAERDALEILFIAAGIEYRGESLIQLGVLKMTQPGNESTALTAFGRTQSYAAWCREFNMPSQNCLRSRLAKGMSPEDALTTPSRREGEKRTKRRDLQTA